MKATRTAPRWERFINDTFNGDRNAVEDFRRMLQFAFFQSSKEEFITAMYDDFEARGLSVSEALQEVERAIHLTKQQAARLHVLRTDMSSRLGGLDQPFDRKKHTHNLGNL